MFERRFDNDHDTQPRLSNNTMRCREGSQHTLIDHAPAKSYYLLDEDSPSSARHRRSSARRAFISNPSYRRWLI